MVLPRCSRPGFKYMSCAATIYLCSVLKQCLFNVHKLDRRSASYSLGTLASDAKFLNKSQILIAVLFSDILEQSFTLTDQLQQAAAGSKVMLILTHMIR